MLNENQVSRLMWLLVTIAVAFLLLLAFSAPRPAKAFWPGSTLTVKITPFKKAQRTHVRHRKARHGRHGHTLRAKRHRHAKRHAKYARKYSRRGASAGGTMVASFYDCYRPGQCSRSKRTANGERFQPNGFTAAHRTLPFNTRLHVCRNGRCVVVRVNDRGPFIRGRHVDLSRGAAVALGMLSAGTARVQVTRLR